VTPFPRPTARIAAMLPFVALGAGWCPAALADDSATEVVVEASKTTEAKGTAAEGYRTEDNQIGPLGWVSAKDTPYSINTTSGELIQNTNAHTLGDALKSNPTASVLMSSAGYSSMARMMVRGFTAADQSEVRDGLVDRSFSFPPIENVDRLEVMNGFSGFLYGFSALGGTVNYVSKRPTAEPLWSAATGVHDGAVVFEQADVGGPVPGTDDKLGYRINAYHEGGDTRLDKSSRDRTLISGRFEYALRDKTKLWADIWHQKYRADGLDTYFALGTGVKVPSAAKFDASKMYGQSWTYNEAEKTLMGVGFDSELNDTVSVRAGYRYGTMWRRYDYVGATLTNMATGAYTLKYTTTPRQNELTHSAYALTDLKFDTFGVGHTVTVGYTGTDYLYNRGDDVSVTLGTSSLSSPKVFADPNRTVGKTTTWQAQYSKNFLIGDRIALTDSLTALAGVARSSLEQTARGTAGVISPSNYTADKFTPSLALTWKPIASTALYASYMEALTAGESTTVATAVNKNTLLPPSSSTQVEAGVKTTLGKIDVNAALFRINKINSEIDPADNVFKQDGREIHQGLEVTLTGKPFDELTLVGGFTLMDAHVEKATANRAIEGKTPVNVPESQAALRAEYALPFLKDVTLVGGVNYYGKRPVDATNTDWLDAATTFNAGLRWEPTVAGHKITAALNVDNLFDTAYWTYFRSGDGLLLGAPRVVSFSLRATW